MGRRAWLLLAALLVGAVVAVGALSGGLPSAAPARPPADPGAAEVQRGSVVLSVDLTPSGTVWLTTAGVDCGGCVLVWRRGPDEDAWVPLRQVGSDHLPGQVRVSDSGSEGLIGGGGLWVTHDGGDSWTGETDVAVGAGDEVQVEVGESFAWALVRREGRPATLWRAALDDGAWRPVALPPGLDPDAAPTAAGDELVVWVTRRGLPQPVVTTDGGRTWRRSTPGCERIGTTTAYATCSTGRGLELLVRAGAGWETWPLSAALGPARNLSPVTAAESVATGRDGTGYVVVRGNLVVTHDRGLGGWARVE